MYICIYLYICICIFIYMYVYMYISIHMYMYIYIHLYIYVCMYNIYVYIYIYVYLYVHRYTQVRAHTHTHQPHQHIRTHIYILGESDSHLIKAEEMRGKECLALLYHYQRRATFANRLSTPPPLHHQLELHQMWALPPTTQLTVLHAHHPFRSLHHDNAVASPNIFVGLF